MNLTASQCAYETAETGQNIKDLGECDVLIVGAGMSGVAAARSAADLCQRVVIVEKSAVAGGLATQARVGTICGLYLRSEKEPFLTPGNFLRYFTERYRSKTHLTPFLWHKGLWFLPILTAELISLLDELLFTSSVEALYNHHLVGVSSEGDAIISLVFINENGFARIRPKAIIDCSGSSVVTRLGGGQLHADTTTQASALTFEVAGLPEIDFTQLSHLIQRALVLAIERKQLPPQASGFSLVPSTLRHQILLAKLGLPLATKIEEVFTESRARQLASDICLTLSKSSCELSSIRLHSFSHQIGHRGGALALGRDSLTENEILGAEKKTSRVASGSWPMEHWGSARKPWLGFFPELDYYDISADCLTSCSWKNLFFAGKLVSAQGRAISSARVLGTCLSTGFAAGALAAHNSSGNTTQEAVRWIQHEQEL